MKSKYVFRLAVMSAGLAWFGLTNEAAAQVKDEGPKAKPPAAPAKAETLAAPKLDILTDATEEGKSTKEEIEQTLRTEMGDGAQGDNKKFTIKTTDDITGLAVGDLYKNEDTVYKVFDVKPKGAKGGTFGMTRLMGMSDPQRRWVRISGSGPVRLSSSLSLLDLYMQGGPFLHPIALLFVCMVILTVNGVIIYRRKRICPEDFVMAAGKALAAGDLKSFEALANSNRGLLAAMCRAMISDFSTTSTEEMRTTTEGVANAQVNRLRIPIRALNLIAVAAPLLGLLGTIIGMVIVFEGVAGTSGAGKASVLAAGIRVKLFSTACALMVAIPALFIFFIFNQRLNLLVSECNNIVERFAQQLARRKPKTAGEGIVHRSGETLPESAQVDY